MSNTVIIGDLHLEDKYKGYLQAQEEAILSIVNQETPSTVVFLGDITEQRRPDPATLLTIHRIFENILDWNSEIIVVVGNHDQNSKADDGVTYLNIFEKNHSLLGVYISNVPRKYGSFYTIPYFEDEGLALYHLGTAARAKNIDFIFAHLGFKGALNSAGNEDFSLKVEDFKKPTFLGHIHENREINDLIYVVGTPYDTSFQNNGIPRYYYTIDKAWLETYSYSKITRKEVCAGPKFYDMRLSELEFVYEDMKKPNTFPILRIHLPQLEYENSREDIINKYHLRSFPYFEFVFDPIITSEEDFNFLPPTDQEILDIDRSLLQEYVSNQDTSLEVSAIMEGLKELENED